MVERLSVAVLLLSVVMMEGFCVAVLLLSVVMMERLSVAVLLLSWWRGLVCLCYCCLSS